VYESCWSTKPPSWRCRKFHACVPFIQSRFRCSREFRKHPVSICVQLFNSTGLHLCVNVCCTGQRKIANDSDDSINGDHDLRAELARANDKIAIMDGELTQLKAIIGLSGKKL